MENETNCLMLFPPFYTDDVAECFFNLRGKGLMEKLSNKHKEETIHFHVYDWKFMKGKAIHEGELSQLANICLWLSVSKCVALFNPMHWDPWKDLYDEIIHLCDVYGIEVVNPHVYRSLRFGCKGGLL